MANPRGPWKFCTEHQNDYFMPIAERMLQGLQASEVVHAGGTII
jgi:hypothetical protein